MTEQRGALQQQRILNHWVILLLRGDRFTRICAGPEGADEAEPMDEVGEDEDAAAQLPSTPPAQAVEADDDSVPSPGSPPAAAGDDQEETLSPAQPADEATDSLLQQVPSEATAAQTGAQPWPMPPRLAAATQSAAEVAANEAAPDLATSEDGAPEGAGAGAEGIPHDAALGEAAPKQAGGETTGAPKQDAPAQAKPRLPPSNLVTSWGPSAPARRIMAHTAPGPPSILAGDAGEYSSHIYHHIQDILARRQGASADKVQASAILCLLFTHYAACSRTRGGADVTMVAAHSVTRECMLRLSEVVRHLQPGWTVLVIYKIASHVTWEERRQSTYLQGCFFLRQVTKRRHQARQRWRHRFLQEANKV